jgi:hypothetical protein
LQDDIHLPTDTVREAVMFSSLLRSPGVEPAQRASVTSLILRILDLEVRGGGSPGGAGG